MHREMHVREADIDHEQGAQNRERGPDWRFIVGLSGGALVLLYSAFNTLAMMHLSDVKAQLTVHDVSRQEANSRLIKLETDMGYIKMALDEIRQIVKEKF